MRVVEAKKILIRTGALSTMRANMRACTYKGKGKSAYQSGTHQSIKQ